MRDNPTMLVDDPRLQAALQPIREGIAVEIDLRLAELAEIADPNPGFDRRKEQKRYDRIVAELDEYRFIAVLIAECDLRALELSAELAEDDALNFDLELERLLQ